METSKFLWVVLFSIAVAACGGGGGGSTANSPSNNLVATAIISSAPLSSCPNGGITVNGGIDLNGNGVLDASEVTSTQYICNGSNGLNVLASVTNEPAGTNCTSGGKKVSAGPDTNGNSTLDISEVTSSGFVCNGVDGSNGTNGLNTLVAIVTESAGANCASGGKKITSGLDTNSNSVLDAGEVSSTNYVCNGATGPAGPGVTWVNVTGTSVQAVSNTGYMADNAIQLTVTLPVSPAVGDVVQVTGVGTGGWKVAQNAGQTIITNSFGNGWTSGVLNFVLGGSLKSVATSTDGTKLVAAVSGYSVSGRLYTSSDSGVTWTPRDSVRNWSSVASSADGTKLVAADQSGYLYTSNDSGVTWTPRDSVRGWSSVASSADGTKLAAADQSGYLYTSNDSGVTWTPRDSVRSWSSVASSADGTKLVAADQSGYLYTSNDSGVTWTPRDSVRSWSSVASSADGAKLVAAVGGYSVSGRLYTSSDSGVTWTPRDSVRNWLSVASSADGTKLVAASYTVLCTSIDSGVTWIVHGDVPGFWSSVASSADGSRLYAIDWNFGLSKSITSTAQGSSGSISGSQYASVDLQYIGNNNFIVRGQVGNLTVQ